MPMCNFHYQTLFYRHYYYFKIVRKDGLPYAKEYGYHCFTLQDES